MYPDEYEQFVRARQRARRERAMQAREHRSPRRPPVRAVVGSARQTVGFRLVEVGLRLAVAPRRSVSGRTSG